MYLKTKRQRKAAPWRMKTHSSSVVYVVWRFCMWLVTTQKQSSILGVYTYITWTILTINSACIKVMHVKGCGVCRKHGRFHRRIVQTVQAPEEWLKIQNIKMWNFKPKFLIVETMTAMFHSKDAFICRCWTILTMHKMQVMYAIRFEKEDFHYYGLLIRLCEGSILWDSLST